MPAQQQAPVLEEAPAPSPLEAPASPAAPTPPPVDSPPRVLAAPTAPAPAVPSDCSKCFEPEEKVDGRAAFLIGIGFFDLGELNDRLAAAGYSRVDGAMTVIGGAGHGVFPGGFVAGGMGAAVIGPSGEGPGNLETDFAGGFGMADFGFAFVHTRAILFSLLGGIGGYGWSYSIDTPGSANFDRVLSNPERGTTLSRGGMLGALTLSFEGRVPVGKVERNRQGFFSLGARVSGMWGPPMGDWSLSEGSEATSSPDTGMAGFYASLTVGFGGWTVEP